MENEKKWKKILKIIFLELQPVIINQLSQGKTKLGVYLIGIFALSMTFFFGEAAEQIALANDVMDIATSKVPSSVSAIGILGVTTLTVGIGHDLIKRSKGSVNIIKNIIKQIF